jgi:alpha-N-acetylglucosaminidase
VGPVDDYSARIWSGLVKDYYLERWKRYFDARESGKSVDLAAWEVAWVEQDWQQPMEPEPLDVVDFSRRMLALSKDIAACDVVESSRFVGYLESDGPRGKGY